MGGLEIWRLYCKGLLTLVGDVAQLVEHLLCKQGVVGSIPSISTIVTNGGLGPQAPAWFQGAEPLGGVWGEAPTHRLI